MAGSFPALSLKGRLPPCPVRRRMNEILGRPAMIRTTIALAAASLLLVACDAKPAPEAAKAEPAPAPAAPGDADAAAAAKAMNEMAAAMNGAGAAGEIKN